MIGDIALRPSARHFVTYGAIPMTIGPFLRMKRDWILVVGLRSFTEAQLSGCTNSTGSVAPTAYDAHWTTNDTWSTFGAAMIFPTQEAAIEYLQKNRERMELAKVED